MKGRHTKVKLIKYIYSEGIEFKKGKNKKKENAAFLNCFGDPHLPTGGNRFVPCQVGRKILINWSCSVKRIYEMGQKIIDPNKTCL